MKYYMAFNPNRNVCGCRFEQTDVIGGQAVGVYATEDPSEISKLDGACLEPSAGVEALDIDQYVSQKKRKIPDWKPFPITNEGLRQAAQHTSTVHNSIKGNGAAVVVENPIQATSGDSKSSGIDLQSVLTPTKI